MFFYTDVLKLKFPQNSTLSSNVQGDEVAPTSCAVEAVGNRMTSIA